MTRRTPVRAGMHSGNTRGSVALIVGILTINETPFTPNFGFRFHKARNVLVYPGGAAEIFKPKTAMKYELMWKERLGFARMAIKNLSTANSGRIWKDFAGNLTHDWLHSWTSHSNDHFQGPSVLRTTILKALQVTGTRKRAWFRKPWVPYLWNVFEVWNCFNLFHSFQSLNNRPRTLRNRYPILPCACVGTEDMLDILFDLPLNFLKGVSPISALPVAAPNSLQKIYFWFGDPIPTEKYQGDGSSKLRWRDSWDKRFNFDDHQAKG